MEKGLISTPGHGGVKKGLRQRTVLGSKMGGLPEEDESEFAASSLLSYGSNNEIEEDALSTAVLEVLNKDNYMAWSALVKTYLMAQDLWDVVEATTEPPKPEDDEAAFKDWSNKNSMALNVLQVSCGHDALSKIRGISSAKIVWNTLAEKYIISKNTNSVALIVLGNYNYVDWSARVKTYLTDHDLWDIIEANEADKNDEGAFKAWSKKNSLALHVIQISCGPYAFPEIIDISSAKIAWDTLAEIYNVLENTNSAVLKDLDQHNYKEWSVRIKTYLMAHDLWDIIEGTIKPPRQEDDEAAFKAWNKKNFMALQAIKISSGIQSPRCANELSEIKSAKDAWDILAKNYNVLENTTSAPAVLKDLNQDNYKEWSVQVKTNLMAHDLWDIIEGTTEPPRQEDDETAFKAWSKKNFMALHEIQNSCRWKTFSSIFEISSAKIAWDTLTEMFNQYQDTSGSGENGRNDYVQYEALKKAVQSGDWNTADEFLKCQPGAVFAKITPFGHTTLHVAVKAGHEHIVEKLVDLMSEEHLAIKNSSGHTALVGIINAGNYRMAACMLTKNKNKNLLSIKDSNQEIPVIQAISNGHIELGRYLYSLTPLEVLTLEKGVNGATLCTEAIRTRCLDIALDLIQKCPRLALDLNIENRSPLYTLADMHYAFTSGDQLVFWKRWIYSCIQIQPASAIGEIRLNIQNIETCRQSDQVKIIGPVLALLRQLVSNLLKFLGIKDLYEMKLLYVQSHELLDHMCKEVSIYSNNEQRDNDQVYRAIFRSIEKGNFEFIFAIVRANPDLLWSRDEDSGSIFTFAVLQRQAKIFSLMYGIAVKNSMTTAVDDNGNNILHMAGMKRDSVLLNQIPGAALQMQRELQWFKEVESIVLPKFKESLNSERLTPRELFTKNHKDLMEKGEQWMKGTATSCTVVGALIVTIMFAAAFTVPGGNNQDTGFPLFFKEKLFMLFIISDALSLFSSTTSVLIFLGILTSRYAEDDFFESLPRKMIIGLSTLFFSIAAMMIAFSAALLILLHRQSWIFIPVVCLASVPIALFVLMQFPLLADMFISSYGRGIFDKKMERWV